MVDVFIPEKVKFYRLRCATDMGFTYDQGDLDNESFAQRVAGKRAFAKAFVDKIVSAKLVNFTELSKKESASTSVIVMGPISFIDSLDTNLIGRNDNGPFLLSDPNVVAWMSGISPHISAFPLFIVRADLEEAQTRVNKFFSGFIEDLLYDGGRRQSFG